jgi:hypothetical protein
VQRPVDDELLFRLAVPGDADHLVEPALVMAVTARRQVGIAGQPIRSRVDLIPVDVKIYAHVCCPPFDSPEWSERFAFFGTTLSGATQQRPRDFRGDHSEIATYIHKALESDFIGNVIDVCPVGALTDKTFRFKNRVWFLKPQDAHRDCPKCSGKVTIWNRGDEVYRVTARKDQWGEVKDFICNECRFEKKKTGDWVIEGPTIISRQSVISAGHYVGTVKPQEVMPEVMDGRKPKLLMDIHSVSEVNRPEIDLSEIEGPAHSTDFKTDHFHFNPKAGS